jgi:hypothetical protein
MCRQSPLFTHDFLLGMQTQLPLYTLSGFSLGVQAISTLYSQDFLSSAAADHQLPFVQCQNSLVFQACGVAFNDIAEAPQLLVCGVGLQSYIAKAPSQLHCKRIPIFHNFSMCTYVIITFQKFSHSYVSSTKSTCFHYHPMVKKTKLYMVVLLYNYILQCFKICSTAFGHINKLFLFNIKLQEIKT